MALLGSCDAVTGFFSTSWGASLERDMARLLPKITVKNAVKLANDTAGDPKMAKLVAEKILEALKNTTNPAEKAVLLNAGLIAANNASNLITVMMSNIDAFSDSNANVVTILEKIQAAGDVRANANLISGLLNASGANTSLAGVSQDNLTLAAVTLLLADAQEHNYMTAGDQKTYLDQFETDRNSENGEDILTPMQKQALTLAGAVTGGVLKDVLKNLKLKTA